MNHGGKKSTIELRTGINIPIAQLFGLYDSVNWIAYTNEENRKDLDKAIRNSDYLVSAWDGEKLVGLARALSDDVSIFYLQDILVRPEHQGQGIGKQLLQKCLQRYQHVRSKILLTEDEERQRIFYEKLGYRDIRDLREVNLKVFVQIAGAE